MIYTWWIIKSNLHLDKSKYVNCSKTHHWIVSVAVLTKTVMK